MAGPARPATPHPSGACSHLAALVPEELPCILDDLLVCQLPEGLGPAEHQHLPQGHAEGPHVAGRGELPLCTDEASGSRPPFPQHFPGLGPLPRGSPQELPPSPASAMLLPRPCFSRSSSPSALLPSCPHFLVSTNSQLTLLWP